MPFNSKTYAYNDTAPATRTATTNGHWTRTTLDGFGRTTKSETGDAGGTKSTVDTVYDSCGCNPMGKMVKTSMPYAPNGTVYWKQNTYDGLGRTVTTTEADGTSTTTYAYLGNTVQVTDPTGKWKKFTMDAFGNLTSVLEPDPLNQPSGTLTTTYAYDILNHLTTVTMPRATGTQTRTFNYTTGTTVGTLLLSATNPENGTVTYTYNSDKTLATKTDALNQQFSYTYDNYKRVTQVNQGQTLIRQFYYDTNPLDSTGTFTQYAGGRLAAVQNAPTTNGDTFIEMYSYTQPGETTKKRLRLSRSITYSGSLHKTVTGDLDASYGYDNEGRMTSATYPQSSYYDQNNQLQQSPVTTYAYGFDTLGRPTSMTGPGVDGWGNAATVNIVNNAQYGPSSELLQMSFFGATETRQYNNRLQMTYLTVPGQLNISYNFATQNNGQIASQTDNLSGEQITYQYDALKRLYSATASAWTQTFTYDGFGNLTDKIGTGTAPTNHSPVNAATNQLTGYSYDPNGNLITTGFGWDPENRMSYALAGNTQYAYDSKNKRVWVGNFTCVGQSCDPNYNTGWQLSSETIFFYGVDGRRLASYTPQVQYSYGTPQSIYYLLGEERVFFGTKYIGIANTTLMSGGTAVGRDRLESAGKYFPYGEERNSPQWPNDTLKFASYTRDSATGLDYADQRYYAGGSGRFLSPDPYTASGGPAEPGSWNRYAYVGGDPANYYDPQGLFIGGPPRYDPGQPPTEDFGSVFCAVFPDVCEADNDRIGNPDVGGPPEPGCSIELWQRGAGFSGNPGGHTYLLIDDPTDGQLMVEAGPDHDPGPNQGTLRGFENPPGDGLGKGTGHASDPGKPNNHEIGTPYTGADACSDINEILSAVTNYNSGTRVPYFLLGTYNSNGFTFTLLSDVGLSGFFGSLPKRPNPFHPKRRFFPGWGEIVPGLVPSP